MPAHQPTPTSSRDNAIGRCISLAEGGLGQVFVARDEEVGREVALKRIKKQSAHAAEQVDRFQREAEITARLEHPGIVPVYGVGL